MNHFFIVTIIVLLFSFVSGLPFLDFLNIWKQNTCLLTNIQVQESFDLTLFSGRWYETHRLNDNNDEQEIIESSVIHCSIENGLLKAIIEGYDENGEIIAPQVNYYRHNNGHLNIIENITDNSVNSSSPGPVVVVETDYVNYAIMYSCSESNIDGECESNHHNLWILSRFPYLGKTIRLYIGGVLKNKFCIDLSNIIVTRRNSLDFRKNEPLDDSTSCQLDSIEDQTNFSFQKFIGFWYHIAQSRIEESQPLEGAISFYKVIDNVFLSATYYGNMNGQCIPPIFIKGNIMNNNVSRYTVNYTLSGKQRSDTIKILYSDYHNIAIIYLCYKVEKDGTCDKSHTFIDFLSRSQTISRRVREKLNSIASLFCVSPENIIDARYSVKCIPSFIEKLMEERQQKHKMDLQEKENEVVKVNLLRDESAAVKSPLRDKIEYHFVKPNKDFKLLENDREIKNEVEAVVIPIIQYNTDNEMITAAEDIVEEVLIKDDVTPRPKKKKNSDSSDESSSESNSSNSDETSEEDSSNSSDDSSKKVKNKKQKKIKNNFKQQMNNWKNAEKNEDEEKIEDSRKKNEYKENKMEKIIHKKNNKNSDEVNSNEKKSLKNKVHRKDNIEDQNKNERRKNMNGREVSDKMQFGFEQKKHHCTDHYNFVMKLLKISQSAKVFIPQCDAEGYYEPVQCNDNNECWCVTEFGEPIPGTHKYVDDMPEINFNCD